MRDGGSQNGQERATQRAARTVTAWSRRGPKAGPLRVATRHGEVVLDRVALKRDGELEYLDVHLGGETQGGDPHFRVVNPPTLVRDPAGDVVAHGERWREDPLAALAEAIGSNGGALAARKRRHGR